MAILFFVLLGVIQHKWVGGFVLRGVVIVGIALANLGKLKV